MNKKNRFLLMIIAVLSIAGIHAQEAIIHLVAYSAAEDFRVQAVLPVLEKKYNIKGYAALKKFLGGKLDKENK